VTGLLAAWLRRAVDYFRRSEVRQGSFATTPIAFASNSPAGGIEAVAKGDWVATFTYPTGAKEAIEMSKKILLDCATSVEPTVTVETTAITAENAKQLMGK
jgi:hypothetical protein